MAHLNALRQLKRAVLAELAASKTEQGKKNAEAQQAARAALALVPELVADVALRNVPELRVCPVQSKFFTYSDMAALARLGVQRHGAALRSLGVFLRQQQARHATGESPSGATGGHHGLTRIAHGSLVLHDTVVGGSASFASSLGSAYNATGLRCAPSASFFVNNIRLQQLYGPRGAGVRARALRGRCAVSRSPLQTDSSMCLQQVARMTPRMNKEV